MMGRYFPYRIHPLSVAELLAPSIPEEKDVIRMPRPISDDQWEALNMFGGFPEPLTNGSMRFCASGGRCVWNNWCGKTFGTSQDRWNLTRLRRWR